MGKEAHRQFDWSGSVEHLEEKIVMSADPLGGLLGGSIQHHAIVDEMPPLSHHSNQLPPIEHHLGEELPPLSHHQESQPDFWIDSDNLRYIDNELERIEQSLANAHDQSGMTDVTNAYGFDGTGQTVAIIDSGIAYDHFALGGGLGSNYRVVGGWDFTSENDADPYDDGGAGSHGTHVAGIVGASGGTHEGVAPGVDLVGLRVFDDAGNGYFSWVENALQWVHDNKDSFENPITAVNLSLGVASWNSDSIPSWANLENEFNLLKQDGIFISVSAGNSFTNFNQAGLSYPAASPHVVPVASVDDNGMMSYYSQRNHRVIAAPGRGIYSTVPDYAGNNNGITDDYASFSGTSMAAPYVAGASVIIREAMEFVGYTNITQDTIYDHMVSTADSFYDSATDAYYNRLNMDAAIDALMPTDEFGSTVGSAFNVGVLNSDQSMSGVIGTIDDVDYFKFTASATGSVSFTVSNLTHKLTADWTSDAGGVWSGTNNETFTIDVVAGQEYTVGFSSDAGIGYYDLDIVSEASEQFTYTDWGAHSFTEISNISNSGENWYRVVANNTGYFTAEAFFDGPSGQLSLEFYNSNLQSVATGSVADGTARVNTVAGAGTEFFLKVTGANNDIDFRLTNLVSVSGTTIFVDGTSGADTFSLDAGSIHTVTVNGAKYHFYDASFTNIQFNGGAGEDSISIMGTAGDETLRAYPTSMTFTGETFEVTGTSLEAITAEASGGYDLAYLYDSAGDDRFYSAPDYGRLKGSNFDHRANGFDRVYAIAENGGDDRAHMYDSSGDDRFYSWHDETIMKGSGYYNKASNFDRVYGFASTGDDRAHLHGTDGNDLFHGKPDHSRLQGSGFYNWATGFNRVYAFAYEGSNDRAYLYGSEGDDIFHGYEDHSRQQSDGYYNYVKGYDQVFTKAGSGGSDRAYMYDSTWDDTVEVERNAVRVYCDSFSYRAEGYDTVEARCVNGGNDQVDFTQPDSASDSYVEVYSEIRNLLTGTFDNVSANPNDDGFYSASTNELDHIFSLIGGWA